MSRQMGGASKEAKCASSAEPRAWTRDELDRARKWVGKLQRRIAKAQREKRYNKANPILIGEPGVGKSAIVEGLAQLINTHHNGGVGLAHPQTGDANVAQDMDEMEETLHGDDGTGATFVDVDA